MLGRKTEEASPNTPLSMRRRRHPAGQDVAGCTSDINTLHSHLENSPLALPPSEAGSEIAQDKPWFLHTPEGSRGNDMITCNPHEQIPGTFIVKVASKTITFDLYEPVPILSDHLMSLIRYNIYRAVAVNSWAIGIDPRLMHSDILSPFTSNDTEITKFSRSLPPSLRPTAVQRSVPHHPYIDLFPFPSLRDRLIELGDTIDEDELCADFAGENLTSELGGHTGLISWGEPWDPHSWEVAEPLWEKWPTVLKGCSGLLQATNYWRQRRDEPRLVEIL